VAPARTAAKSGADLILTEGRDRSRYLRRAGYSVQTYATRRGPGSAINLTPLHRGVLDGVLPAANLLWLRQSLIAGIRRLSGLHCVTVAYRGDVTPAAVAAAAGAGLTASLVGSGGDPRRRSTFLVAKDARTAPDTAIKVGPLGWAVRGAKEQLVMRRLQAIKGLAEAVPTPIGHGLSGTVSWSAESAAKGHPLPDVLRRSGNPTKILRMLERVTAWFATLGAETRNVRDWANSESALPLRGELRELETLRMRLQAVPGVLVHGDVGTGGNVFVDDDGFSIIDWETAAEPELPLTDVLPLLCNALAALRGHRRPTIAAQYVLRLCAGREADSPWLLSLVRSYCRQVGVPLDQAGALAALAWGYQASMRLVHQELVMRAGDEVVDWLSPADAVARGWPSSPDLGTSWSALTAGES
jgi:thiamine kinase-like enzyme